MKNYFFLLFFILTLSVFPQENQIDCINTTKVTNQISSSDKNATVIWSEDFSNGFPNGWRHTNSGSTICNWMWSTDGSWGYWNGNSGNSAAAAINSTTASNGFLISDPDSANHYAYGQPSGQTYQYLDSYFNIICIFSRGSNRLYKYYKSYQSNNFI